MEQLSKGWNHKKKSSRSERAQFTSFLFVYKIRLFNSLTEQLTYTTLHLSPLPLPISAVAYLPIFVAANKQTSRTADTKECSKSFHCCSCLVNSIVKLRNSWTKYVCTLWNPAAWVLIHSVTAISNIWTQLHQDMHVYAGRLTCAYECICYRTGTVASMHLQNLLVGGTHHQGGYRVQRTICRKETHRHEQPPTWSGHPAVLCAFQWTWKHLAPTTTQLNTYQMTQAVLIALAAC